MRGKLTDQDLTNYALNDGLDARERLYVESMLAVSEQCRQDIYQLIELGQMLEEGFEREAGRQPARLTAEQRATLLENPRPRVGRSALGFVQRTAVVLSAAACVAFAFVNLQVWKGASPVRKTVAQMSDKVSQMVSANPKANADIDKYVGLHFDLNDLSDASSWVQTASDGNTICTPPSWPDSVNVIKNR